MSGCAEAAHYQAISSADTAMALTDLLASSEVMRRQQHLIDGWGWVR
jgi:hypothetical protein